MRIRFFLFILNIGLFAQTIKAQVDTEFWFAAPEVSTIHADRPISIRLSSLYQSSTITISQPANSSFTPIVVSLDANSTSSIDLTDYIDNIENTPPNQILNYGLLIKSTNPITAYYEVEGSSGFGIVNTDIFALKGSHALGKEFYVPFQTHWDNNSTVDAWASFDIVATENNTTVTITPTANLVGHASGIPYSIVLQKGQTYSARSNSTLAIDRPAGSHIQSDKPIAVTVKDDSIYEAPNYDLAGDQIIPINYIGKEYIAIKISGSFNRDRLYILATKANTDIFIDGNPLAAATLNAGETYEFQILNPTAYITSSDSIYVWHIAGFSNELGGAIIPPIGCTGSRQIGFTRSTEELFFLEIIVKAGYEQYFKLNDNTSLIPSSLFSTVAGTSNNWKYASIPFDVSTIASGSANLIKNDSADFHLGLVNGGSSTGFRYGFFSDFGFLELGSDKFLCEGDSIRLDAGFFQDSYLWNTGALGQYIIVKDTGTYQVEVAKGACNNKDSVHVGFYPKITTPILGNDTSVCANVGYRIRTVVPYSSYLWIDGSTSPVFIPPFSGPYSVEVKNEFGCRKSDTISIVYFETPLPKILYNTNLESYCKDSIVTLSCEGNFENYLWSTGESTQTITTTHNEFDYYKLVVTDTNNCQNDAELRLDCSPIIGIIPNLITPNGDGLNDNFYIEYLRPKKWIFEVYNSWGDRVYRKSGYDNSFSGENLSEGIYYFSLRHIGGKGDYKSWLQIIR